MQLGLIETDHLRSVVFQEIIYDLLLGLRVQTSDIKEDQFELLPFSFDSGEISIDSGSLFVGECVSSTVPVASSIPARTVVFSFGLLLLWYQSRVDLAIGSIPSSPNGIFLGLLLLLRQLLILLAVSSSPTLTILFCLLLDFLLLCCPFCSSRSFFLGASAITGRIAELLAFGYHCYCCYDVSRCPVELLRVLSLI